jgi:hypothetical protein
MSARIQLILDASAKLEALHRRIDETVRARDRSAADRERWSEACSEFHRLYPTLFYPGGDESLYALKRHETEAIETALDFLDADPKHYCSGYTKEKVWRRLRNAPLTDAHKRRLEEISLRYLDRPVGREFWHMARVMGVVATEAFWNSIATLVQSSEEPKKTRASYVLVYRDGAAAGAALRKKLRMERLMKAYNERLSRV